VSYYKLCVCSGASPSLVLHHPNVVGIRDSDSVLALLDRLKRHQKIVIVGNGGIALELVHAVNLI
jgi:pyridine nucleotide-disulfide oxidoreductase domain-containing protein 1